MDGLSTALWQLVTQLGNIYLWMGFAAVSIALYLFLPRRLGRWLRWEVFGVFPSMLVSSTIAILMKFAFMVPRPCAGDPSCPTDYSFPSEHSTTIFAAAAFLILSTEDNRLRLLYGAVAVAVAASRVALGVHRIVDVVVGAAIGTAVSYAVHRRHAWILRAMGRVGIRG